MRVSADYSVDAGSTNHKGLDSLQALFFARIPAWRGVLGGLSCGCQGARKRRNGPFPGQPSLFSLFALRVVAASRSVFTGPWRGLFVVNQPTEMPATPKRLPSSARKTIQPRTSVITREELYELVWSAPMIDQGR